MKQSCVLLLSTCCLLISQHELAAQWVQVGTGLTGPVTGVTQHGPDIFVSTNVVNGEGVYRSTDNGLTFTSARGNLSSRRITASFSNGSRLFAGRAFQELGGFQFTTNAGISWTSATGTGWTPSFWSVDGTTLYASGQGSAWYSTDGGTTWMSISAGLPTSSIMSGLASLGTNVFLSYSDGPARGVYRATAPGQPWMWMNNGLGADTSIWGLGVQDSTLLAFTSVNRIYRSTNNGASWSLHSSGFPRLNNSAFLRVYTRNNALFVGLRDSVSRPGVYTSVDAGVSWLNRSTGLTIAGADQLFLGFGGSFAYVGTGNTFFYRRPISEVTSITPSADVVPSRLMLDQNYPNPFNPSTTIVYQVLSRELVELRVFDALGREVATLVNDVKEPGEHSVTLDGSHLSSGVYLYRLQTAGFVQTRKLVLLR